MIRHLLIALAVSSATLLPAAPGKAGTVSKLSPDLRAAIQTKDSEAVLATIVIDRDADPAPIAALVENAVISRQVGPIRWIVCKSSPASLARAAERPEVRNIVSSETYQPATAPPDPERDSAAEARTIVPPKRLLSPAARTRKVADIHKAPAAWAKGYTGEGVVVAIVDTGVDFGHPDLNGTQARIQSGPYAGWPFAYDTLSGYYYALNTTYVVTPSNFWNMTGYSAYAETVAVTNPVCDGGTCTADLTTRDSNGTEVTKSITWPATSMSGEYRYGVHPDPSLINIQSYLGTGYIAGSGIPSFFVLIDEGESGVYDTVYVDLDGDGSMLDEKPMRKGDELAGADLVDASGTAGTDGTWDISAGMLTWISDGVNTPPGMGTLYPDFASVPDAGTLVAFVSDSDTHGTGVASDVAAQGVITDPNLKGLTNPLLAGGADASGVGDPVMTGMAPDAKLAAFEHGLHLTYDAWTLASLGFDGQPQTGDEANIVNNSFGSSSVIEDGWDYESRFVHAINAGVAPNTAFLASTGNGGHGYGTVATPSGGSIIGVGASTNYGSMTNYGFVTPEQITWGAVQPWSNRGPGMGGEMGVSITAVGAWGTGAYPLNVIGNGEAAYRAFGGTSMASPIACGVLALVHEAFAEKHGRFPTWEEAKELLQNGARDLGYDPLTMGAGDVDADLSTDIAAGDSSAVTPSEWRAGDFDGMTYPSFPNVVFAGDSTQETFDVTNPSGSKTDFPVSAEHLKRVYQENFTVNLPSGDPPDFIIPTYLRELTDDIALYDPDLVRVQAVFPFSEFDAGNDYNIDSRWRVWLYDWSDRNGDTNLWTDTNVDGMVQSSEIDIDGDGIQEYTPISVGYVSGTYLEASAGRDVLSRAKDGVFLGLQRRTGTNAMSVQIRITYFKRTAWDWITLSESSVSVPADGASSFTATLSVPANTRPGVYQGILKVGTQTVPIVSQVAANDVAFDFGAASLVEPAGEYPYDNGHVMGGFDWSWRYESGDWRLFPFVVPGDTKAGTQILVETNWDALPTDVDSWLYGPHLDEFSDANQAFFGPYGQEQIAGSANLNLGGGLFAVETATGGPTEAIGAIAEPGYHFLSLHNVSSSGAKIAEPLVGSTYAISFDPYPATGTGSTGSWTQSITSTRDIPQGLSVSAFGLSQPVHLTDQTIDQDDPNNVCTASWTYSLDMANGAYLKVVTSTSASMDIDLFVYRDNGDGTFNCGSDSLLGSSTTSTSNETVELKQAQLPDGKYFVVVHGWSVPGGSQLFDIDIEGIYGSGLTIPTPPSGPVTAGTPVEFTVNWSKPLEGEYEGMILVGPSNISEILRIPVVIGDRMATDADAWMLW
ncbi:S8 family serine peptidase [bacterium]|nr:S8 family serine peptidase [bacterium]